MEGKKLIEIKNVKRVVFVGDTHGDLEASQKVIEKYLDSQTAIVFLGDYVDRGPFSKENIDFLIQKKKENPKRIYLLQGNHEGYPFLKFSPANFWESLSQKEYQKYVSLFEKFPLIAVTSEIIALHGALPDLKSLEEIEKIKLGDKAWQEITWGDFVDESGDFLGIDPFSGRPSFGRDYFFKIMERFQKKILVRAHDPTAPLFMFENRCLTIFTSSYYQKPRMVAIADLDKKIKTAKDLKIELI